MGFRLRIWVRENSHLHFWEAFTLLQVDMNTLSDDKESSCMFVERLLSGSCAESKLTASQAMPFPLQIPSLCSAPAIILANYPSKANSQTCMFVCDDDVWPWPHLHMIPISPEEGWRILRPQISSFTLT